MNPPPEIRPAESTAPEVPDAADMLPNTVISETTTLAANEPVDPAVSSVSVGQCGADLIPGLNVAGKTELTVTVPQGATVLLTGDPMTVAPASSGVQNVNNRVVIVAYEDLTLTNFGALNPTTGIYNLYGCSYATVTEEQIAQAVASMPGATLVTIGAAQP